MGIRIDLYKREDIGREIRYIPLMEEFLDSEELADSLTWSVDLSGKGDESGVFGFVSYETLKEIYPHFIQFKDLKRLTGLLLNIISKQMF